MSWFHDEYEPVIELLREADLIGRRHRDRGLHARLTPALSACCARTSGTTRWSRRCAATSRPRAWTRTRWSGACGASSSRWRYVRPGSGRAGLAALALVLAPVRRRLLAGHVLAAVRGRALAGRRSSRAVAGRRRGTLLRDRQVAPVAGSKSCRRVASTQSSASWPALALLGRVEPGHDPPLLALHRDLAAARVLGELAQLLRLDAARPTRP